MEATAAKSSRFGLRFSMHALLGVHSLAAGVSEFIASAPLVAGLIGVCVGLVALQFGVLAACTRGLRTAS